MGTQKNETESPILKVINQIMFATLVILSIALLASTANARTLLQEEAAAAVPATWYPGQFAGQYFNPSYWTNFYSQVSPLFFFLLLLFFFFSSARPCHTTCTRTG